MVIDETRFSTHARRSPVAALAILTCCFVCWTAAASEPRPRVGLALSGGGARGIAHVGVLRELEAAGIQVDYIAGTSVGAIVGGMYAAGLSPDAIEEGLASIDWEAVFRGKPDRESLSFRRKEDHNRYVFDLEAGFREGRLITRRGVLSSLELDYLLSIFTLPVAGVEDFDHLSIPFRAVASDVTTGRTVVLGEGSLALAIRASMAIPGVFAPVELDGKVLIDGGILDNLPVDVARDMGADVVIAVDAGTPLLSAEELITLPGLTAQAMTVATQRRIDEQRAAADLLIVPDLEGLGTFDYFRTTELVDRGEVAARAHEDELRALAARLGPAPPPRRTSPASIPVIGAIRVEGNRRVDERLIRARIRTRPGEALDLPLLREDLGRISQIGEFAWVRFELRNVDGGDPELVFLLKEKDWGPHYLRFGANVFGDLESNDANALLNYTWTSLNARGGEWSNDFQIGRTWRVRTGIYQPLDFKGRFFVAPSAERQREISDVYDDGSPIAEYEVSSFIGSLDVGTQFGKYGELRFGLRYGRAEADVRSGVPALPDVDADVAGIQARLAFDRLDSANVPRQGRILQVAAYHSSPSLGADDSYDKVSALFGRFVTRDRNTYFVMAEAGGPVNGRLPAYDELVRGGLLSFSGFEEGELRGQYFGVVRPGYYRRLMRLPPTLGTALYVGGWLEAGNVWQEESDVGFDDLVYSATVAVALDTRVGPLYVAYGVTDSGSGSFQLRLGPRF